MMTVFDITVVNAWKLSNYHNHVRNSRNQNGNMTMSIKPLRNQKDNVFISLNTNFSLFNSPVVFSRNDPASILKKPISETTTLRLRYDQNFIGFEFSALHFVSPERNRYAYLLEGLDQVWTETDARRRFASYANVDPGDYVFRVRDMTQVGFKTSMQVETQPVGSETTPNNIQYLLDINRSQVTDGYDRLSNDEDYVFADESIGLRGEYVFVYQDPNPFLQSVPIVVRGIDVITIRGGQAIIITFLTASESYADDITIFERFLASLDF